MGLVVYAYDGYLFCLLADKKCLAILNATFMY